MARRYPAPVLSRRSSSARALAAVLTAMAAAASPASGADLRRIGPGLSAAGIDLSGLTVEEARSRLSTRLGPPLQRPVVVGVAGHVFRLSAAGAGLRFDARRTAERAYQARPASPPSPRSPSPQPAPAVISVALALGHSRAAVSRFVSGAARATDRRPRDATLHITVKHMYTRGGTDGHHVNQRALARAINAAFDDPAASRILHVRVVRDRPAVGPADLPRQYPAVVTIDRARFRLRLFRRLRFVKSYPIAVGRSGLSTPSGHYRVQEREINPPWHVPHSAWAGRLAGQTIPGGSPNNPLRARWLGLGGGVGIHGTAEDWSIGSRASHGCIRMHVHDVIALYRRVPLGTTVLIR